MLEETNRQDSPLAHFIGRLRTAEIVRDPYPHYYLERLFPEAYYERLLQHLPAPDAYDNLFEITTLKLDHFRHRDQRDLKSDWTDRLPPALKAFWDDFNRWFLGPEVAAAVLDSFEDPLRARFGDRSSWPAVSVECQLIRHRAGYFLGPHSDLHTKLAVLLVYLAPDESATHLGTSIYRPKDPHFSCPNSTHYPFEDFLKVTTVPYRPNAMLAFERSDVSFHGVEPLTEQDVAAGNRDLIQYVLYDRQAREQQLRERRLAAMSEAAR